MNAALPTILGVLLVALAAAAALLPLLRGAPAQLAAAPATDPAEAERFELYRQVLELEFDQQTGKLSSEDFEALTRELLSRAGEILHARQAAAEGEVQAVAATPEVDIDAEVEREIAAARKAFARARRGQRKAEEVAS